MKAYVTSIGESTTDLCVWSLERNGFDVELVYNEASSLADKLEYIYYKAIQLPEPFIRVDADVIVSKKLTPEFLKELDEEDDIWWWQLQTFCMYQLGIMHGGVQYIKPAAFNYLMNNIKKFKDAERPESQMYRLDEFHNPRRCASKGVVVGVHGYKQLNLDRVKEVKERRGQLDNYDFELAERMNKL